MQRQLFPQLAEVVRGKRVGKLRLACEGDAKVRPLADQRLDVAQRQLRHEVGAFGQQCDPVAGRVQNRQGVVYAVEENALVLRGGWRDLVHERT